MKRLLKKFVVMSVMGFMIFNVLFSQDEIIERAGTEAGKESENIPKSREVPGFHEPSKIVEKPAARIASRETGEYRGDEPIRTSTVVPLDLGPEAEENITVKEKDNADQQRVQDLLTSISKGSINASHINTIPVDILVDFFVKDPTQLQALSPDALNALNPDTIKAISVALGTEDFGKQAPRYTNIFKEFFDSIVQAIRRATGATSDALLQLYDTVKKLVLSDFAYRYSKALKNPALINDKNNEGLTLLMEAVLLGDKNSIKELLRMKADVDVKNNLGQTALMLAVRDRPNSTIISYLVKAGADVNSRDKAGTPVIVAAVRGYTGYDTIRINLIRNGANVNAQDAEGNTPLMWTTQLPEQPGGWDFDDSQVLWRSLIASGADPLIKNDKGESAAEVWKAKLTEYYAPRPSTSYQPSSYGLASWLEGALFPTAGTVASGRSKGSWLH